MAGSEILDLVKVARDLYGAVADRDWVVSPGAPVLFFGDLSRYEGSKLRVVTVALNPSRLEFPREDPYSRFPGAALKDDQTYLSALTKYFRTTPYGSWFGSYERALFGMGTSYYGTANNTALHTDIGSVLPTDPTWSKLEGDVRVLLTKVGVPLWHRLVACLRPDILLQSTAWRWLALVEFTPLTGWEQVHVFDRTKDGALRKRPIRLNVRWYSLSGGKRTMMAHIPAAQAPMALLSDEQKRQAGRIIRERWEDGI